MKPTSLSLLLAGSLVLSSPGISLAQNSYIQTDLVSDIPGRAERTDANLANPWGIVPGPTGVFWVANQVTGTSTLYQPDGTPVSLVVEIPGGSPTGVALANTTNLRFEFPSAETTATATFLFVTLNGTVAAWNSNVDADDAIQVASTSGAVYTGVALAATGSGPRLYAANFAGGTIDAFDDEFAPVTLGSSAFDDPNLPSGYAPFNVANRGGQIWVAYAQQGTGEAVSGAGLGYISVFDLEGNFVRRFTSNGALNAPWAMVVAPGGFGEFSGALLVGNEGDGRINAYRLSDGEFLGTLEEPDGDPIVLEELWGLEFGIGSASNRLYFAAGIEDETHGLFGYLTAGDDDDDDDGDGEEVSCNESKGFGFWKQVCRGVDPSDSGNRLGVRAVLDRGHGKGKGNLGQGNGNGHGNGNGSGNGHGHGRGVSADSLDALMACVNSELQSFGDGACFTAGCDLLGRKGRMTQSERLAQRFLVLAANSCSGLICDEQTLLCSDDDDEDGDDDGDDEGDDEGDDDEDGDDEGDDDDDLSDLIEDNDLDTVGDVIAFVDAHLCGNGTSDVSVSQLKALVDCALGSGRDDDDDDEDDDGDDDGDDEDDDAISGGIAHGRIQIKPLGGNPIRVSSGIQARLQVSSDPLSVVQMGIYDAQGRLVTRLLRDVAVGAPVEVRWDGKDQRGQRVPAGTYFYRATGANSVAGGRIVVLQ